MTLYPTPSYADPIPETSTAPVPDLREHVAAACATLDMLKEHGAEEPLSTLEDERTAAALMSAYAADPVAASSAATPSRIGKMTPAALRHIDVMLTTFGQVVVEDAVQLRHYVTNKLLEETDNPDPRIRIRALELLGKISDVGLFVDKTEVTVTHQTTDELKESLRAKLSRLINPTAAIDDAEVVEDTSRADAALRDALDEWD